MADWPSKTLLKRVGEIAEQKFMDEELRKAAQAALDWLENKYPEHMTATRLNNTMRDLRAALAKNANAAPRQPVRCQHSRYSLDVHEQVGHCIDCGAEGRMRFVVAAPDDAKAVARYEWLREHASRCETVMKGSNVHKIIVTSDASTDSNIAYRIDAVIDAAMKVPA